MNEEIKQRVCLCWREETERNSGFVEENLPASRLGSQSVTMVTKVTMVTDPEFKLALFLELEIQSLAHSGFYLTQNFH